MTRRLTAGLPVARQRGFTLVEVLVSSLVLGIGLVGVAGLQALSLKNTQSAFMRSQATAMAYDLADRMRSNVAGALGGSYVPASANKVPGCTTTAGCTPEEIAQNDLAEWLAAIDNNLPAGEGFVCIDSTPDDGTGSGDPQCDGAGTEFAIKIWWDDDRDGQISVTPDNMERFAAIVQL
ncbi:MAG: type IV pilus modification protein PilV [Pseudomonadota bacterium]